MKGREKIDLHCDVNLGVFGLLRPEQLVGLTTETQGEGSRVGNPS